MGERVTKVEKMLKDFEQEQKRIQSKYDVENSQKKIQSRYNTKTVDKEIQEVDSNLKKSDLHIKRLKDELAKVNPTQKDLIEKYKKAIEVAENDEERKNNLSKKQKLMNKKQEKINKRQELIGNLMKDKPNREKKMQQELRESEDKVRAVLTQESIKIDKEIEGIKANMQMTLFNMSNFEYKYEIKDGIRIPTNGEQYKELNDKYTSLNEQLQDLKEAKKVCEDKINEFKEKDAKIAEQMAKAWNSLKEKETIKEDIIHNNKDEALNTEDLMKELEDDPNFVGTKPVKIAPAKPVKNPGIKGEPLNTASLKQELDDYEILNTEMLKQELKDEPNYVGTKASPIINSQFTKEDIKNGVLNTDSLKKELEDEEQKNKEKIQIVVGRNAKIKIGERTFEVGKKAVKEGVNLDIKDVCEIIERLAVKIPHKDWNVIAEGIDNGEFDTTILNVIDESCIDFSTKKQLLEDQCQKFIAAQNGEKYTSKSDVIYDADDLSKTSLIGRFLRREVNTDEKNQLIESARSSERKKIASVEGKYQPDRKSRFLAKIFKKNIRLLPTASEQKEVAEIYNKMSGIEKNSKFDRTKVKENLNEAQLQELEELMESQRVQNRENSKRDIRQREGMKVPNDDGRIEAKAQEAAKSAEAERILEEEQRKTAESVQGMEKE